jgi:predicted nucleotidyltransferase component of viral defense system
MDFNDGQSRHVFTHKHIDYYLEPLQGSIPFDLLDPQKTIVKVTFANDENLIAGAINSPDTAVGNGIKIASPLDLLAAKILAMDRRSQERDFIDVAELIKSGVDLQKGFEAAFAISKLSPLEQNRIQYGNLKEDFKAKTLHSVLPNAPERVEIIREAAAKVDIDKMQKILLKAVPTNFKQTGMGR